MNHEAENLYAEAKARELATRQKRIVAEISKTWPTLDQKYSSVLATRFEDVIEANRNRGYILESWQMVQNATLGGVYETIIAVFVEA